LRVFSERMASEDPKKKEKQRVRTVSLLGTDQPGILAHVTKWFSQNGITIDDMEVLSEPAPFSGIQLFKMKALVGLPPSITNVSLETGVENLAEQLGVDIWVESILHHSTKKRMNEENNL